MSYDAYGAAGYGAPAAGADPYGAYGAAGAYGAYAGYPGYGAGYGAAPAAGADEVRTIFITGFPTDVKERELNNLLRFVPGYEACQMTWKNDQAQGFALFSNMAYARAACDQLQHVVFEENSHLRCELARKNMYVNDTNKRPRTAPPPAYGSYGAPPAAAPYRAPASGGYSSSQGDNPPCNTLFVGNISDTVDENELRGVFAGQPGFRNFKLQRGARSTSAFVEFDDVNSASAVHASQQGAMLSSSDRPGGLRVQFAKNPFGKKRDITGQLIDTPVREGSVGASGGQQVFGGSAYTGAGPAAPGTNGY